MVKMRKNMSKESTESAAGENEKSAESIIIELPISPEMPGEFGLHIDTRLDLTQSTILRRIANQLDKQQTRLSNGRRIVTPTDALKHILEQAAISLAGAAAKVA